jgi:4-carboxymuconolactone decarboxylase
MSRVPLTTVYRQPEPIRQFMARRGELNLFRLLANAPAVFVGWTHMVDEMFDSPTFTARMRELIILRVAHLQGSPYELRQHLELARSAGLTEARINAIVDIGDLDAAGFNRTERAVLDLVTELCTTHQLCDDTFAAAHAALGDEAVTELLMIVSCYYGLALVLNAVDLDVDTTSQFQP